MIFWMLTELERNLENAWYEKDLAALFPKALEQAKRDRLVKRLPIPLSKPVALYHRGLKRSYVVIERDDGILEGFDPQDPEAEPIELNAGDMAQWTLDFSRLSRKYQEVNALKGQPEDLGDGLHFLGESGDEDHRIAFVLGLLYDSSLALIALSALPSLLGGSFARIGVACPTFTLPPTEVNRLDKLGVVVFALSADDPLHLPSAQEVCQLNRRPVQEAEFEHDDKYAWVRWRGREYTLTPPRAEAVTMLHEAHKKNTPGVHWSQIKARLNGLNYSPPGMRDLFSGTDILGSLVIRSSHGVYRLNLTR